MANYWNETDHSNFVAFVSAETEEQQEQLWQDTLKARVEEVISKIVVRYNFANATVDEAELLDFVRRHSPKINLQKAEENMTVALFSYPYISQLIRCNIAYQVRKNVRN